MKLKENAFVPHDVAGDTESRRRRVVNPNLRPKGGFRFKDADGVEHFGDNFDKLVDGLTKYRVRVGRPLGDPEGECIEQICTRSPQSCFFVQTKYDRTALSLAVTQDLSLAAQRNTPLVDEATAKERASICRRCSELVNWDKNCPPCVVKAVRLRETILDPKKVISELHGKACFLARDDAVLAVWRKENQDVIKPPGKCWREAE